ncbi:MAG: peptidase [Cyanobacteria bacterium SW_11_48_12]|nr:MAG: peptidase [Cyanobacteria bacterium SW_11_48_12]
MSRFLINSLLPFLSRPEAKKKSESLIFETQPNLGRHWARKSPAARWWKRLGINGVLSLGIAAGVMAWAAPVRALQVRITPEDPQLGDTLSVVIETDSEGVEPTVSRPGSEQSYPVFATGSNRYRAFVPTTPLNEPGRVKLRIQGEDEVRNLAVWLRDRSFPTQRISLSGDSLEATQLELDRIAEFKEIVTPKKLWDGKFVRPNTAQVSTVFGVRRYYNGEFAKDYYHSGVDYAANAGAPVVAPATGRVKLVGREKSGFRVHGNTVGIDHGQGVLSIFLHLDKIKVEDGELVEAGEKIGTVGSTGASTGPHLHWGLYVNGVAVDPVPWRFQGIN